MCYLLRELLAQRAKILLSVLELILLEMHSAMAHHEECVSSLQK